MKEKNFYEVVASENEGVEVKNVKSIFLWYDLLSCALSFQLIFIASRMLELDFLVTTISAVFVILTDTIIKIKLQNDSKSYVKLKNQMPLVKLWTVPLLLLAVVVIGLLISIKHGLI